MAELRKERGWEQLLHPRVPTDLRSQRTMEETDTAQLKKRARELFRRIRQWWRESTTRQKGGLGVEEIGEEKDGLELCERTKVRNEFKWEQLFHARLETTILKGGNYGVIPPKDGISPGVLEGIKGYPSYPPYSIGTKRYVNK